MVGTTLDKNIKREEKKKRETQENITKTRLTQNIDNSNPYQSIQPILPGQQAYPVQFEPLVHVRLSRSTYKVTTFIEFKPYIESFRKFQNYLETFLLDLADPTRASAFSHLLSSQLTPQGKDLITSVITRSKCETPAEEMCSDEAVKKKGDKVLSVSECLKQTQLICRAILQYKAIANATQYIRTAFDQVREEFMSVIDHLEAEQDETDERVRREHNE